jgi:hypothetical protein
MIVGTVRRLNLRPKGEKPTGMHWQIQRAWTNSQSLGPSLDQNPGSGAGFSGAYGCKGNRIIKKFGAGDGNRTHVPGLGFIEPRLSGPHT